LRLQVKLQEVDYDHAFGVSAKAKRCRLFDSVDLKRENASFARQSGSPLEFLTNDMLVFDDSALPKARRRNVYSYRPQTAPIRAANVGRLRNDSEASAQLALEVHSPFHARLDNARLELCRHLRLALKGDFKREQDERENAAALVLQFETIHLYGGVLRRFVAFHAHTIAQTRAWKAVAIRFAFTLWYADVQIPSLMVVTLCVRVDRLLSLRWADTSLSRLLEATGASPRVASWVDGVLSICALFLMWTRDSVIATLRKPTPLFPDVEVVETRVAQSKAKAMQFSRSRATARTQQVASALPVILREALSGTSPTAASGVDISYSARASALEELLFRTSDILQHLRDDCWPAPESIQRLETEPNLHSFCKRGFHTS
jgi:hypothetical protein